MEAESANLASLNLYHFVLLHILFQRLCVVGQAASLCGFEISGLEGTGELVASNGVYIPDKSGGGHNGHPVFVHVRGHRFVYYSAAGKWRIASLRRSFPRNAGFAGTAVSGSFSPVVVDSGGWKVSDGTALVPCAGVTVAAISGECFIFPSVLHVRH